VEFKAFVGFAFVALRSAGHQVQTPLTAALLGASAATLLQRYAEQVALPEGSVALSEHLDLRTPHASAGGIAAARSSASGSS
jgi:hypothetical protein